MSQQPEQKIQDTQQLADIKSSINSRTLLGIGNIYANQVKCLKCNNTIRSKNRHDFVTCPCGSISVDGGSHYLKRSGDIGNYEELSIMYNEIDMFNLQQYGRM